MNLIFYLFSLPYMRWHIVFTFTPLIIMWIFYGKYLIKYKKTILFVMAGSFSWGLLFNLVASTWLHIWNYYPPTLGIWFLGLPIEEFIFISVVPIEVASFMLILRKKNYHG